ncbi:MAG: hypothetical protein K1000chlam4_00476 [Chlamydiae bacterium]|nr:hypothetical protein [Chlamydiota bacterium]
MILHSISQESGIAAVKKDDLTVYCVGISTAGAAEMRMAQLHPKRHIIATTIDAEGARFVLERVDAKGLSRQIAVKVEDVSKPLPYEDNHFDFIYARLVLHYLPRADLTHALNGLYRVLKGGSRLFVVVRSSVDLHGRPIPHGEESYWRHFHSEASIREHLLAAGFKIEYVKSYEEHLCDDFYRRQPSTSVDTVIETVVLKIKP